MKNDFVRKEAKICGVEKQQEKYDEADKTLVGKMKKSLKKAELLSYEFCVVILLNFINLESLS